VLFLHDKVEFLKI